MFDPLRLGKGMTYAAWTLALALLTLGFNHWLGLQENPNRAVKSDVTGDGIEVKLVQNRHGHYRVRGAINGQPAEFLIDTGATEVSVPAHLAERLHLSRGSRGEATTANGMVTTYATRIAHLSVGEIVLHDVRAHINPGMTSDEVLLGMTALRKLEFTQRGDTLTLRQIR